MASRREKRQHPDSDAGDDDVVSQNGRRSESSASLSPETKRQRRAVQSAAGQVNGLSRQSSGETIIGDGSDELAERLGVENGEEYEAENEEDELEEEDDEERAIAGERYLNESRSGFTQSMGVIEKISLRNFMCHDHLSFDLGPKLNFVIGHNGSGKSAILTGLTIALGAKASVTSRGQSLKSFVKEGKSEATVEVWIKNTGEEAYKHEVYGNRIIIQRTIRADGGGTWKLKSERGGIVSARRDELDAICDHANIQVDNPINILTQDAARQFLSSSSPSDKYEFFLRGTLLSQLEMEYDVIARNLELIKRKVKEKRRELHGLKAKAKNTEARYATVRQATDLREQLQKVRAMYVWAQVKEREKNLEHYMLRFERHKNKLSSLNESAAEKQREILQHEKVIKEAEANVTDVIEAGNPARVRLDQVRRQIKEHSMLVKALRQEEQTINQQYQRATSSLQDIEERIRRAEMDAAGGHQKRRLALNAKRDQTLSACKDLEGEQRDMSNRVEELEGVLRDKGNQKEHMYKRREDLRTAIGSHGALIRTLQSAKSNHLSAYSANMPKLVELVNGERRWRGPVVGPIGAKIKVKDLKWAPVLESVIGNTLNAFCVTNHQDRALLLELKRRAKCDEIPVLTGSDELFDYSAGEPEVGIMTILRILDIQDEFVKRQLINSAFIERAALVEQRAEGDRLLRRQPRNVKVAFSLDLFRLQYGESGGSTQTLQPYRGPPRLSSDVEARLNDTINRQREDEISLRELETAISRLNQEIAQLQEDIREARQRAQRAQKSARAKYAEKEKIDEELRADEPANVSALHEARREFEEDTANLLVAFQEAADKVKEEIDRNAPLIRERDELNARLKEIQDEDESLRGKLTIVARARVMAHQAKAAIDKKISELEAKIKEADISVQVAENQLATDTERAQERYAFIEPEKTPEEYEKEMRAMDTKIQLAAQMDSLSVDELHREVLQTQLEFKEARAAIEGLEEATELFEACLDARLEKWRTFRSGIAMRAKNLFSYFLSTRGYSGKLHFYHDHRVLVLDVSTDPAFEARGDKDPKSLSGGEKSFSTLCLLLSLWEAIGCPIRCLDEFDVFMDLVNRRMSMKLILDAARKSMSTQYILITPQNINSITPGPDVRIHRLADPERNQTTLV